MLKANTSKEDFWKFRIYGNQASIHINETYGEEDVSFDEIILPCFNKDALVSGLIKANYPADRMDAIRNNYELVKDGTAGDKAEEYTKEYLAMQDWRAYSKELSKEIIDSKEND